MSDVYPFYRASRFRAIVFAESALLMLAACGSNPPAGQAVAASAQTASSSAAEEMDTEATIWTALGLAKEPSKRDPGPQTGDLVSPILWQATHDTLDFVQIASEDPVTGALVTDWYSPKGKPTERFRINVFILARALRSDSLAVTVERQERSATGQWVQSTVGRELASDLENTILQRARQIRRARSATS